LLLKSADTNLGLAILNLHTLHVNISLHEYNLLAAPPASQLDSDQRDKNDIQDELASRFEGLSTLLSLVKTYLSTVTDESNPPVGKFPEISMPIFIQMAHSVMVLCRLSMFEYPGLGWDRRRVVKEINFGDVAFKLAKQWQSVPLHRDLARKIFCTTENEEELRSAWEGDGDENALTHAGKVFELMGKSWKNKILPRLLVDMESSRKQGQEEALNAGEDMVMSGTDQAQRGQSQHQHNQPMAGVSDEIASWDISEDPWMTQLIGEGGQEWLFNF
jgi:hypothetical protein